MFPDFERLHPDPDSDQCESEKQALSICVLFTTMKGTLAALECAEKLGLGLGARVRLLVPHVVPYPLPLDQPDVDPLFRVRQFCSLRREPGVAPEIEARLCRDAQECVRDWLRPESIVVIGARRSWFARENRFARRLRSLGHQVILAQQN